MARRINRRQQGDLGEISAVEWLTGRGAIVFLPFGHSPHVDLVADLDGRLSRIQVKTTTCSEEMPSGYVRHSVHVATLGGNQSWSGAVKHLDPGEFDFLFVLTGNGRRWFIPAAQIGARRTLRLGGRKYAEFEIEATRPLSPSVYGNESTPLEFPVALGECPSGQRERAVNASALPTEVRILSPPSP